MMNNTFKVGEFTCAFPRQADELPVDVALAPVCACQLMWLDVTISTKVKDND